MTKPLGESLVVSYQALKGLDFSISPGGMNYATAFKFSLLDLTPSLDT